jgi:hypothetical protein
MLRRRGRRLAAASVLAAALVLAAVPARAAGPAPLGPTPFGPAGALPGLTALWDLARQWLAAALPAAAKDLVLPGGGEHGSTIDPNGSNGATTDPTWPGGEHGSSIDPDG